MWLSHHQLTLQSDFPVGILHQPHRSSQEVGNKSPSVCHSHCYRRDHSSCHCYDDWKDWHSSQFSLEAGSLPSRRDTVVHDLSNHAYYATSQTINKYRLTCIIETTTSTSSFLVKSTIFLLYDMTRACSGFRGRMFIHSLTKRKQLDLFTISTVWETGSGKLHSSIYKTRKYILA